jgi:hypothetical protein
MPEVIFDTPALYGDHHVTEVRRILFDLPGIQQVYASSCFHIVQVSFDPALIKQDDIASCLAQAGYLDPMAVVSEPGQADSPFFPPRQTSTSESPSFTLKFTQQTPVAEREAWPCPGMGLLNSQS